MPEGTRVGVRLVRIMLVSTDLDAGPFAAQIVQSRVESRAVVEGVSTEGTMPVDGIIAHADIAYQVGRGAVHRLGEIADDIPIGFVFDADGIAIGGTRMPGLVGFAYHLGHLSVAGADHIMCRHLSVAVLEPADAAGIRALGIVDYHSAHLFGTFLEVARRCRNPDGAGIIGFFGDRNPFA